jgi:hypothetical protein
VLVVRAVINWVAGLLVLGVVGGFAWLLLAHPAEWQVTKDGMVLSEEGSKGRFGVIVTYVLIGIVVSLLWGLVAGLKLRDMGWTLVPFFAIAALVAGVLTWRIGVAFGPPDPATVTGTSVGDKVPQRLAVDTFTPFLIWPIFALVGLFVAVYSSGDGGAKGARRRDEVVGS